MTVGKKYNRNIALKLTPEQSSAITDIRYEENGIASRKLFVDFKPGAIEQSPEAIEQLVKDYGGILGVEIKDNQIVMTRAQIGDQGPGQLFQSISITFEKYGFLNQGMGPEIRRGLSSGQAIG